MCVRRKVRCCSTKPRCSICARKGDECVYSLKRRPGPRARYSSYMGPYSTNNPPPTAEAIKYNTRRMSIEDLLSSVSKQKQDSKKNHRVSFLKGNVGNAFCERKPTRVANHDNNNYKPPIAEKTPLANSGNNKETSSPVHQSSHVEKMKTFQVPASMEIPDDMFDLMDDSEHLMPTDFVKLEHVSTISLSSDTSIESDSPVDCIDHKNDDLDYNYGKFFDSLPNPENA